MSEQGFRLRHLVFVGPGKQPASVTFGPGLNVVYGASETGKSFIVEAVDFMLGGGQELRDIEQRVGYDRIFLGIETLAGDLFTLQRSVDGGNFRLYAGLHTDLPPPEVEAMELADQHNERNETNLSAYLLARCGLAGKRVRRNNRGDTNSLSFRNLARLLIVTETEIMERRSPLSDGNPVAETPNFSTFKLLLTGVDDSALIATKRAGPEEQTREAQLSLLDKLIDDYRDRLKELTKDPKDLSAQLGRIDASLAQHTAQLGATEAEYKIAIEVRKDLRKKIETARERNAEIETLLTRFTLLQEHYDSDVARLQGIQEGGSLFQVLGNGPCPLCGAVPEHHQKDEDCDGNVEAIVDAAQMEIAKIHVLRSELVETIESLRSEGAGFSRRLPALEDSLAVVSGQIENLVAPGLARLRATYAQLADKRGTVREALAIYQTIQDALRRRVDIENTSDEQKASSITDGDLPTIIADEFAQKVESILKKWHFPDADRVTFDHKKRDLIIAGKLRGARGKGLRAITHAAFTIGLLEYCTEKSKLHPGFVILDSPLLAYRAPRNDETQEADDRALAGTDLNEQFYAYVSALPETVQVILIENRDPTPDVKASSQAMFFSKNPNDGRYGFFPAATKATGGEVTEISS